LLIQKGETMYRMRGEKGRRGKRAAYEVDTCFPCGGCVGTLIGPFRGS